MSETVGHALLGAFTPLWIRVMGTRNVVLYRVIVAPGKPKRLAMREKVGEMIGWRFPRAGLSVGP